MTTTRRGKNRCTMTPAQQRTPSTTAGITITIIIAARCNEWILDAAPAQPTDAIGDWPGPRREIERTRALTRQNLLRVRIMRPRFVDYSHRS
jgi:hypothetical protein